MNHWNEQAVGVSVLYYRHARRVCNSNNAAVVGKHYSGVGKQNPEKEVISVAGTVGVGRASEDATAAKLI